MLKTVKKKVSSLKRTPKNYRGVKQPQKKLDQILDFCLSKIRPENGARKEEVFKAWYAIIGHRLQAFAHPTSLYDGILMVKVKNQTLYSLLCTHEKKRLLQDLQKKFSKKIIKDIRFRMG